MDVARTVGSYTAPLGVLALAIIIVFVAANFSVLNGWLHDWNVLPEPEHLTKLYFSQSRILPSTYIPGTPQSFQFTVHNLEYRTEAYSYHIVEQSGSAPILQTTQLASGGFVLSESHYRTTQVTINPSDLGSKVKIVVDINRPNQSIDYLAAKETT
jgi:hypothetical protein